MTQRKGIILAGGSGKRLYPITMGVSKQLLPIYDKPMIYYPLTVLMMAGIREVMVITTPNDADQFQSVLGDGSQWGISLQYKVQTSPDGLAQAFILAESFLAGAPAALVLGDNIFCGDGLPDLLQEEDKNTSGATIFTYQVADPERYGVVDLDKNGIVKRIVEKPSVPPSNYAVTGLYFVDETAPERAKNVRPSARGELEITCLLKSYLCDDALRLKKMGGGYAWMDAGTHDSLLDAGNFVRTLTERQGVPVGSPGRVALDMGWLSETNQKNFAKKKNLVERPAALQLSKPRGNVTNTENISDSYAEMDLGGLTPNNLISNCLNKDKDQTGLILSFQKTDEARKSGRVAGFMEEMDRANSS
jgi:glucose-1-phosphate thymidylyltransferase